MNPRFPFEARTAVALLLATFISAAAAHDSWFVPLPLTPRGELQLALGTGETYPRQHYAIDEKYLARTGCRRGDEAHVALAPLRYTDTALILGTAPLRRPRALPVTCWMQLQPIDLEIAPDVVPTYLKEIRAPAWVHEAWDDMRARGVPWHETYVKHARIELPGAGSAGAPKAIGLGLEVLVEAPLSSLVAGRTVSLRVLRDGVPLPGLPIELRGDRMPAGFWRETDAEGRISVALPAAGRWLARGTELRQSPEKQEAWDSRFVTLIFDVQPAPRR